MITKREKVKLGAFLLLSAVIAMALAGAFLGIRLTDDAARYYVIAPEVGGLEVGSSVRIRGVRVGSVAEYELAREGPGGVRVTLAIDENARIFEGSKAYFEFAGVSGLKHVNISGGNEGAGVLPPGSRIPYGETTLDVLTDKSDEILAEATELLEASTAVAKNLAAATEGLEPGAISNVISNTNELVSEMTRTADALERTIRVTREPLEETLQTAQQTLAQLNTAAVSATATLEQIDQTADQTQTLVRRNDDELRTTLRNLRQASQSFKTLGRELRRRPSLLFFGRNAPERELP